MKALTGIEKMALKAEKISSGYIVNGSLPWVSHIREGGYCGVIASVPDKADHEIMFLLDLDERAQLKECPKFSGMEGTSTWAIELRDYFVNEDHDCRSGETLHKTGEACFCVAPNGLWFGRRKVRSIR